MSSFDPGNSVPGLFLVGGTVKSRLTDQDRHVVQDHIASLLQVQNLVLLIGSGASFHLGSPQTRNLNNDAVQSLIEDAGEQLDKTDTDLLAFLNPKDDGDLEKLLNGLQLGASLADQTGLAEVTFSSGDNGRFQGPSATPFRGSRLCREGLRGRRGRRRFMA